MSSNGAVMTRQVKPWFQRELESITREPWKVRTMPTTTQVECGHGMLMLVAHTPGLDRPFLNDTQEREFVGKLLLLHAKDYRIGYREGQRG